MSSPSLSSTDSTAQQNAGQTVSRQILSASYDFAQALANSKLKLVGAVSTRAVGYGLMFAGELASNILAKTGNQELAGYFGNGADPLFNVGEFGDGFWADAGEVTAQTVLNLITSPLEILQLFENSSPVPQYVHVTNSTGMASYAHASTSINYYHYNSSVTGKSGYGEEYISIEGSSYNDVLKGRLLVKGGGGNDTLIGRSDTSEDAFLTHISNRVSGAERYYNGAYADLYTKYAREISSRVYQRRAALNFLNSSNYRLPSESKLEGGAGDDKLFSKVTAHLEGGAGNDYLKTTYYSSTINGGSENDVISLEANAVDTQFNLQSIDGGTGHDHLLVRSPYNRYVTLTDTRLQFSGNKAATLSGIEQATLIGNTLNNAINAAGFSNTVLIDGGAGNDTLTGASNATSTLIGGAGDDVLVGGSQGDVLIGGTGTNLLTGGNGADVFLLNTSDTVNNNISDFNQSQGDIIVIDTSGFGRLYENDLVRFSYGSGELKFDNRKIAVLENGANVDLQFGKDVLFTEYWVDASI